MTRMDIKTISLIMLCFALTGFSDRNLKKSIINVNRQTFSCCPEVIVSGCILSYTCMGGIIMKTEPKLHQFVSILGECNIAALPTCMSLLNPTTNKD